LEGWLSIKVEVSVIVYYKFAVSQL